MFMGCDLSMGIEYLVFLDTCIVCLPITCTVGVLRKHKSYRRVGLWLVIEKLLLIYIFTPSQARATQHGTAALLAVSESPMAPSYSDLDTMSQMII